MLNQYMVELQLPRVMTSEFTDLIPAQRARVNEMIHNGDIRAYSLSLDRSKLWVIMIAKDELHVSDLLSTFPVIDFCKYAVSELLFHDMATHELPRMSLN